MALSLAGVLPLNCPDCFGMDCRRYGPTDLVTGQALHRCLDCGLDRLLVVSAWRAASGSQVDVPEGVR